MIIFLYGEDTFRLNRKLNELKEKFLREVDKTGNAINEIDGDLSMAAEIKNRLMASSLFARKEFIIIRSFLSNKKRGEREKILNFLKKDNRENISNNIVVFVENKNKEKLPKNKLSKFLQDLKFTQEFRLFTGTQTINWIKDEVKKRGGFIKPQAAALLGGLFGSDLWQLDKEIDKLINYKRGLTGEIVRDSGTAEIENADVENLCRGNVDENIFAFTDAISARNKALAFKLFEQEVEAGVAEQYLLYMLTRQFKILLQIRTALNQGFGHRKIINKLKLHPFVVQKSINQVKNFDIKILKLILSQLIEIDREIKTGCFDVKTKIALLIAKL